MPGRDARLSLTLTVGNDPISGTVTVERDPPRPFYGWLELMTVIDTAREKTRDLPAKTSPRVDQTDQKFKQEGQ
jgi:hypothetical protein